MQQALAHPHAYKWVGVDHVRADGPGLYRPDDVGVLAAIVDAGGCDLVAVDLRHPERWRRRIGIADLLGEENLIGLNFSGEPLLVQPSPAEWLNANGNGIAILEYTPSLCGMLLTIPGGLSVDRQHMDFARELRERLIAGMATPKPNIFMSSITWPVTGRWRHERPEVSAAR